GLVVEKGVLMRSLLVLALVVSLGAVAARAATDPITRCAVAEIKATAKKTNAKLKCYATAAARETAVDPACLAKAETKFDEAWARAIENGGCGVLPFGGPPAADTVESKVDACVADLVTTVGRCGKVNGVCGGVCPQGLRCFEIGVGCFGESEPCRCHSSTTTCPTTSSTTSTTSTTLP